MKFTARIMVLLGLSVVVWILLLVFFSEICGIETFTRLEMALSFYVSLDLAAFFSSLVFQDKKAEQKRINEFKIETIEEFVERLKEKAEPQYPWLFTVDVDDIDSLVKEMEDERREEDANI